MIEANNTTKDITGKEVQRWTCSRIHDLAVTKDGKTVVVICQEKKIRLYNLANDTEDA